MQKPFLTVRIRCKPAQKSFLENNFGTPVIIPDKHVLNKVAVSQLFKHNSRPYGGGRGFPKDYTSEIELGISQNNFLYDGHSMNEINMRMFNEAVDDYMRAIIRSNLDSLLLSQEKQTNWKKEYNKAVALLKKTAPLSKDTMAAIRVVIREMEEHEINIKEAIDYVLLNVVKVNLEYLPYETVKKDYYRYRFPDSTKNQKKSFTPLSPDIN